MSAMSNYLEGKLLDHLFRDDTYSKPSNIYVGLVKYYVAGTLEAGTVTQELSGGSYARVAHGPDNDNWETVGAAGATQNMGSISFPTASSDWGRVSGVIVTDHATAGNVLLHGALTTPRDVRNGDQFIFASGDLDITFA